MTAEIDRLNALLVERADEIASLKKTIEWYQAQAAQRIGAAARAEIAGAPAQGEGEVPVGFKLAPIVPTAEMIRAGENSMGRSTMKNMESYLLIYRDMLAAAPAAPLPEQTGPRDALNALLTRIDDAAENYERFGEVCRFEGNSMVYAATLEEIIALRGKFHVACLAASPSPALAPAEPHDNRGESTAPVMAADWVGLTRRLYVELFYCHQQMMAETDENGAPLWLAGVTVPKVLADAKEALDPVPRIGGITSKESAETAAPGAVPATDKTAEGE